MTNKPMRMTDVPYETAMDYINSDDWVLEQKLDGARAMVIAEATEEGTMEFQWLASGGGQLKFAAAAQHLPKLEQNLGRALWNAGLEYAVLDGELMIEDGVYYLFDAVKLHRAGERLVHPGMGYLERRQVLDEVLTEELRNIFNSSVRLVRTAKSTKEKQSMWDDITKTNVEGGMAKRRDAKYEFGTRTQAMVKLKLVKTADVVVTSVTRTFKADGKTLSHGKAELAVTIDPADDPQPFVDEKGKRWSRHEMETSKRPPREVIEKRRTLFPVGNASLIGKDLTIEVGSVVEVAYLYFQEAMIQPRILRKRLPEEKLAGDCDMAQFPKYSRQLL